MRPDQLDFLLQTVFNIRDLQVVQTSLTAIADCLLALYIGYRMSKG